MKLNLGGLAIGLYAAQAAASNTKAPVQHSSQESKAGNKTSQIASPRDVRNTLDKVTSYAQLFAQASTKSMNGSRTKGHTSETVKGSQQGKGSACIINDNKNSTKVRKTGKERRDTSKRRDNLGAADTAIYWECPCQ